jgi:adenine-specific DNA-methyltransferase
MVTNAQTSILGNVNKIINGKNKLISYEYTPSTGKHKNKKIEKFIWNKTLVVWLSDSAVLENHKVYKLEEIGTLWDDVSWGRLDLQGGVHLKSGKKPEALIKRIIELGSSNENDIILDFFMGTGTTCAVAHKIGRQYIGVEQIDYGENSAVVRLKNVINGDPTGISKAVAWQGGGDFVYLELMKWNENFVQKIQTAKTKEELKNLWETMKEKAFLSYKVDIKTIDEHAKDFDDLSIEDQKRFLLECLDKNHLYVNYSEIDDEEYGVSEEDKKLNREFYGNNG